MDYLDDLADRVLRKNPRQLTLLAPLITYLMTFMAGTGFTAFATMPVITEVAKENNIRPSRPLSVAVVSSQIAITASPISAAVVFFSGVLEEKGVDYLQLLAIAVPSTFIACMATAVIMMAIDKVRHTTELDTHPEYQRRLALGAVSVKGPVERQLLPHARLSVLIFAVGLVAVVGYSVIISEKVGLVTDPVMERDSAIIAFMLTIAMAIVIVSRVDPSSILSASTFKSGMSASICVLGIWRGATRQLHSRWNDTTQDISVFR